MTNCTYITPCGWCSKWNKRCDTKIGNIPVNAPVNVNEKENSENIENKGQNKFNCYYYNNGDCMGTRDRDMCDLSYESIFYCEKYKEK